MVTKFFHCYWHTEPFLNMTRMNFDDDIRLIDIMTAIRQAFEDFISKCSEEKQWCSWRNKRSESKTRQEFQATSLSCFSENTLSSITLKKGVIRRSQIYERCYALDINMLWKETLRVIATISL
ncbi:unnamed protein product [Caenorhabditis brenneri]